MTIEEIAREVVDCGYRVHSELGPGLLESVYEVVLAGMIERRGLRVLRQAPVRITCDGRTFDEGFRADLLEEDHLLVELKSVETLLPVHKKQVLTYLRLLDLPLGLLINFGAATFKEGIRRIVNDHTNTAGSQLSMHRRDKIQLFSREAAKVAKRPEPAVRLINPLVRPRWENWFAPEGKTKSSRPSRLRVSPS